MKNLLLTLTVIGVAALTSATANAQMAPPMDMSRMINAQLQMQQMGNQMARAAGQAYLKYAQGLRAQGYTGEIPTGVTTQSLNATNQMLMQQGMLNTQAWRQNFTTTTNAITGANNAITGHCTWYTDYQGYSHCY